MQWPFRLSAKQEREAIRDERGLIVGIIQREKASSRRNDRIRGRTVGARRVQTDRAHCELFAASTGADPLAVKKRWHGRSFRRTRFWKCAAENSFLWSILRRTSASLPRRAKTSERGRFSSAKRASATPCSLRRSSCTTIPQIAPESPGDLFDGAEIDEILSLRIMTLTDEEKREMRQSDERARQDSGAHRIHAGRAIDEASRRVARPARRQGGDAMNEWEWQLLEDKKPVEVA